MFEKNSSLSSRLKLVLITFCIVPIVCMAAIEKVGCPATSMELYNHSTTDLNIGYAGINCRNSSRSAYVVGTTYSEAVASCEHMFSLIHLSQICQNLLPEGGGAVVAWFALVNGMHSQYSENSFPSNCDMAGLRYCENGPSGGVTSNLAYGFNYACIRSDAVLSSSKWRWVDGFSNFANITNSSCLNSTKKYYILYYKP